VDPPTDLKRCLPFLLQDAAKGKEDFSCGQYSGDDLQIEAILVGAFSMDLRDAAWVAVCWLT
jgi:hypothetical protein